jgi:hypothetical protein
MEADVEPAITVLLAEATVVRADVTKKRCTQHADSTCPPCGVWSTTRGGGPIEATSSWHNPTA